MSDLKSKFNERADVERAKQADSKAATAKYHETVLREYPRLMFELLARVEAALGDAKDVRITKETVTETLTYQVGSTAEGFRDVTLGVVKVPRWSVFFLGKTMTFSSGGIGFIGANGKIEVTTTRTNPFPHTGIFMYRSKEDTSVWKLGVLGGQARFTELTDKILNEHLEQYFL